MSVVMCQVLKKKFIVRLNLSDIKRMLKSVGWIFMLILACVSCMLILTCVSSMFIFACVSLHAYLVARSALTVFSQCLVQWMPVSCSVLASALFSGDFIFQPCGMFRCPKSRSWSLLLNHLYSQVKAEVADIPGQTDFVDDTLVSVDVKQIGAHKVEIWTNFPVFLA